MHFAHPTWLLAWWVLPALIALMVWSRRQRRQASERFASATMWPRLRPPSSTPREWLKGTAVVVALGLLTAGAARPRWGMYIENVPARSADLFVLLDVSRSMLAQDVAPNRLERAKSDIRDLLPKLARDRVGLIAFAGAAVVKVPLTTDHRYFTSVLDVVDPSSAPRGGSLIGDAIRKALQSLEPRSDRDQAIVLITDGEDHDSFPQEAAQQAAERGVKIFAVGLGDTSEGQRIPIRDEQGQLSYVQHDGQEVWSKMDEGLLKDIALKTGGAYVPARTQLYDLGQIYEQRLEELARGEITTEQQRKYAERFQWFLIGGFALLVGDLLLPRFPQPTTRALAWLLALVVGATSSTAVAADTDAVASVREGIAAFEQREFETAERSFAAAAATRPDDPRVTYNRACALAAQGKRDEAEKLFEQSKLAADRQLVSASLYNLGCLAATAARQGLGDRPEEADPSQRTAALDQVARAILYFRDCLDIDPDHASARHNLELLRMWIKHMEDVWRQRDRQRQRDALGLLEFLEMIEGEQSRLRDESFTLEEGPNSPQRRQAAMEASRAQRELSEEIAPLQDKIREAIQQAIAAPNSATSPTPTLPSAQVEQSTRALTELAGEARREMSRAAVELASQTPSAALEPQTQALDRLDELYRALAPFDHILKRAIEREETLIASSEDAQKTTSDPMPDPPVDERAGRELSRLQRQVAGWSVALAQQARQALEQPSAVPMPSAASSDDDDTSAKVKSAFEKAVELAPQAAAAAEAAATHLATRAWGDALPKQQEALDRLQEIAANLPPPTEQPQDPQQDQQEPEKEKPQPDQPSDSQDKPQPQDDPQSKDSPSPDDATKKESSKKKQNKPKDSPEDAASNREKSAEKQDSSGKSDPRQKGREDAQLILRQARERERDYKQRQKQIQALIRGAVPVDKDW